MFGGSPLPGLVPMRVPIAPAPSLNFRTNASFTMATGAASPLSASVNSRPAISGIPKVEK
jgi:hypothetical protein